MKTQDTFNYQRIETAIHYIVNHFDAQPDLEEIAAQVHLSPYHFQKMFTTWAGVSPKKFLQYISLTNAKRLLTQKQTTLSQTAYEVGLSSPSRLHDLFINIEGMTPAEFKNGGKTRSINYSFACSPFGEVLIASTSKGICHLAFIEEQNAGLQALQEVFPQAHFQARQDAIQQNALCIFTQDWTTLEEIKLHLKGTPFQLKVWESLLKIPHGHLVTYGSIAKQIKQVKASRAVGTAVGKNPIAYLIPCHRVIQSSGHLGQYHWGSTRKKAIVGWEMAKYERG
ncbi:MAG: methylated-DNA--[protein]-cysteine S-methyltransferase [Bacteroidota bacterium]